jgi:RNA polymerase sigma-70 factor (ECF subfamily)
MTFGKLLSIRSVERGAEISDEMLVAGCAAKDGAALAELFHRHTDRVHRVLSRFPGVDARDLEDLVQTTFIEVYRSARGFQRQSAVGSWILGIAVNIMRHHVRGEVRRRALFAAASDLPGSTPGRPDDDVSRRQLLERLRVGLAALPEEHQVVFTLCEIEGEKGVEVARMLGMREGTLWRKLHEARLALRDAIDPGGTP